MVEVPMQFIVFSTHIEVVRNSQSVVVPLGWWRGEGSASGIVASTFEDMFHPSDLMNAADRALMERCRDNVLQLLTPDECDTVAGAVFGSLAPEETDEEYEAAVAAEVARVGEVYNMMEVA
jgi:hypothetical protein